MQRHVPSINVLVRATASRKKKSIKARIQCLSEMFTQQISAWTNVVLHSFRFQKMLTYLAGRRWVSHFSCATETSYKCQHWLSTIVLLGRIMETVTKVLTMVAFIQLGVQCSMDSNAAWQSTNTTRFNASTIIRHKRYLDFLPKSRMFVRKSDEHWSVGQSH